MEFEKYGLPISLGGLTNEEFDLGCGEALVTFDCERHHEFCDRILSSGFNRVKHFSLGDTDGTFYENGDGKTVYVYTNSRAHMGRAVLGAKLLDGDASSGMDIYDDTIFSQVYNDPKKGGGMTYLVRMKDGRFVIIDGGYNIDSKSLIAELTALHPHIGDGRFEIAAWVITHTHDDHIFLLKSLMKDDEAMSRLNIRRFYANVPSSETLKGRDDDVIGDNDFTLAALSELEKKGCETVRPYAGMTFECGELLLEFFYTQAEWAAYGLKTVNDASSVFRIKRKDGKSAMILGDIMGTGEDIVLKMYGSDVLRSDMVQVGHHALYGPSIEIYKAIAPKICFWPINLNGYGYKQYPKITERNNELRALDCIHSIACFGTSQVQM